MLDLRELTFMDSTGLHLLTRTQKRFDIAGSRVAMPSMAGAGRFGQVRFRYGMDGPWTIENVTLDVPAGSTLGIVGSSGSGKSTLTKLLQRLYVPAAGRVGEADSVVAARG